MSSADFSASKRSPFLLLALAGAVALSLGLSGCAGVVSPTNGGTGSNPTGALTISNVQSSGVTNSSVQLSWATNEPATSAIDYGTTSVYGASTPVSSTMVTTHQMSLTGLAQGTTYHFRVRSAAGSDTAASPDQTFSTLGNNAPPSVEVTSPAAGTTLSGKVNLTATASDSGTISGVQFRVDGNNVGPDLSAAPYAYVLDSSTLSNGSHAITAFATDNSGKSATSASVAVKVDNTVKDTTPPTVSITSPANGAKVSGTVAVTATASDNVSVASVQFQLDGANLSAADLVSPYTASWDSTKATNGTHTLRAIATDGSGNIATSAAISVTVNNTTADKTPPAVSITAPAASATVSGTVNVTATASDNVGVAGVQFQVDGVNAGAIDGATPYAFAWDTTKVANGVHRLDAIATNAAGNATTSAVISVTVSNIAANNFSISGTVSGAGGVGATITLSGAGVAATTTNSSGSYTFTGLAKGTYTVTPSHTGFTFSPTSLAETITTANITGANFTATAVAPTTFSISGTVSGTGASGTTITLSGAASATTTTNSTGAFTFTGLAKGTYAITPSHSGFTFTPTTQSATITTANVTGVNFSSATAAATFSISGTITPTTGGSGATVILSGAAGATTTTNSSGAYTFTGLANGSYTVTPSNSGFAFTPASASVTLSGANKTGVNFTAASTKPHSVTLSWNASTSKVSGYNVYRSTTSGHGFVKINSSLVATTTFEDTTVQNAITYFYVTTSVDSSGNESSDSNQVSVTIP